MKVRKSLYHMNLEWNMVRIYQDGLPVCDILSDIVADLSGKGSLNYKLITELIQKGAKIEGTENPELLVSEYNYIKKISCARDAEEKEKLIDEYNSASSGLLLNRDSFIAGRIDSTLRQDETGILFIGMMHHVDEMIVNDIKIEYLKIPGLF